jgi:hypothetical protein
MRKVIISIIMMMVSISYADSYNCDSNCLNGTDMNMTNNSTTGTQTTTANGFSYFTGTTCNGVNLMNNFSNGSQTVKEPNSTTCGYVAPVAYYDYSDNSGSGGGYVWFYMPNTGSGGCVIGNCNLDPEYK